MWSSVVDQLQEQDSIGNAFPVSCQRHPETVMLISEPGSLPRFAPDGKAICASIDSLITEAHFSRGVFATLQFQIEVWPRMPLQGKAHHPAPVLAQLSCISVIQMIPITQRSSAHSLAADFAPDSIHATESAPMHVANACFRYLTLSYPVNISAPLFHGEFNLLLHRGAFS